VVNNNEEEKLEHLYDTIAWPLGHKFGHPYDAFKVALTYALSHVLLYI
jgi:translation initiation factor 2 subunit 1